MNKQPINLEKWNRKEHYLFFSKFTEPFFGITTAVDCTEAYRASKQKGISFFLYYLYRALKAANEIENFRYRIIHKQPYVFDVVDASPTINRPNGTFGFAYLNYEADEALFYKKAQKEVAAAQTSNNLLPAVSGENILHVSALPWIDFSALSHARSFDFADSAPKLSFGKMTEKNGKQMMAVAVHGHHALMDGYHISLFVEKFQQMM